MWPLRYKWDDGQKISDLYDIIYERPFLTNILCDFRYAVQLLAPAAVAAKIAGRNNISTEDIKDISELFLDAKSSAHMLEEHPEKYML